MTCFRPRMVLLGVRTINDVILGKYSPKTPQKGAWIGSFKPKRQNLYIAISPELLIRRSSDLRTKFRPRKALRGWSAITPKANTTWLTAVILKIDMTSYFSGGCSKLDEFRQPDAEWHADYGELVYIKTGSRIPIWRTLYFETGSSYSSAANGVIWSRRNLVCW